LREGSALLAFGSDTAGSVRIPACMTGTVGLKVTLGRWPADGVVPLSPTFDTPGLLARSVCDVAYGFAALDPAGIDPDGFIARAGARDLAGVRIGVGDPFLWRDCDPGIAETVNEAVNALAPAPSWLVLRLILRLTFPEGRFCNTRAVSLFCAEIKIYGVPCGPDALATQPACSQRATASALSSGRVLKAIAAPGAALCTPLITASNIVRLLGGRRMPAPITTQS
jgi:aspartyl-tRNA(Asn)/glutamyl-tRNA(Gln) amidotransferase subunit A